MENQFFTPEEFQQTLSKTAQAAIERTEMIIKGDYLEFSLRQFDFTFTSDKKENLKSLGDELTNIRQYEILELSETENGFELYGESTPIQVNQDALVCWTIDLLQLGYRFDSKFSTYTCLTSTDVDYIDLSPEKEEFYFNEALKAFQQQDYFAAYFNWTNVLKINPEEPNSYYSRAIVKQKLLLWKDAIRDLHQAIQFAPEFVDALNIRAKINYENGNYKESIPDLEKLITMHPKEGALFSRLGDALYHLNQKKEACTNWSKAISLGYDKAQSRVNSYCKTSSDEN